MCEIRNYSSSNFFDDLSLKKKKRNQILQCSFDIHSYIMKLISY